MKTILTKEEKDYFWSKIEYSRKKKAISTENKMFKDLTSEGETELTEILFVQYLNSLEFSIKKQFKDPEKKFRKAVAQSFKDKIPEAWIGVKYSSLAARKKKIEKEEAKKDK